MIKKEDILNYINFLLDKKNAEVFHSSSNHYYYIEDNKTIYKLGSTQNTIFLNISNEGATDHYYEEILLTQEEGIPLIKKMFSLLPINESIVNIQNKDGKDLFLENREEINEKLKSLPEKIFKSAKKSTESEDYFRDIYSESVQIEINGLQHKYKVGEVIDYFNKKSKNNCYITSVFYIPVIIKLKKNSSDYDNAILNGLSIPGWKMHEYPIFNNLIFNKVIKNEENKDYMEMLSSLSGGNNILNYTLKKELKDKKGNGRKNKI